MGAEVVVKRKFWPQKRRWKVLLIIGIVLIVLMASLLLGGYLFLRKSLPVIEGEINLTEITKEVEVTRDKNGVPHILAENSYDLYFAQGFVTAQDRIFQMDLSRRQASGELSEVIGASTLDQDKYFRTLGLRRAAVASYDGYSSEAKDVLQAYADGVNAYIKDAKKNNTLPVEFTFAGYEPTEWTPIDSLTIGKYMAYDLGGHYKGQAFRYYMAQHFSDEKVLELFPTYPEDGATVLQALRENELDITKSIATVQFPNEFNGSNNWVVSGDKTESGLPILADDPHLGLATPSIWYETHIESPDVNVSGVIFAGVPGIILGRNENIAWGVTNVGPDVQDLYIEKRNPDNPKQFEYMGKWEDATVVKEPIKVKDGKTVPYEVQITRHGPIISEFTHDDKEDTALSLRWTALDPSTELEAVMMFNKAKDWEEFKKALTYFHTPAQNFVFAANDGTIAYRANGLIPIRKKGDSSVPVPGWTDEYEWEGYIPWDELPTIVNPEEGFISTANNKITPDDYPYHITNTWAQPYRQQRIRDVLNSKDKITVDDMLKLQFDQHNLQAEEFVPIFLKALEESKGELREIDKKVIELFENWDYVEDIEAAAPLVFHQWMTEFANVLFEDEIPNDVDELFEGKGQIVDQMIRDAVNGKEGIWLSEAGGLEEVTFQSFQRAVDFAVERQGDKPSNWVWGDYHAVPFKHPLSAIKPLNYLFNFGGPTAMGGSGVTVAAAGFNRDTGLVTHGAAWRSVVDFANLSETYNVVGPGQSGHVLSDFYQDQVEEWTTGKYHKTYTDKSHYEKDGYTLILKPAK
ncbi:penicillin acylase family protein [Ferdinandcohnia quinoae]|uniref:Penicillin acylase family protein n=1 Tax=Fredinandcohnia quinoae TaxID=2918902 RepID=A0AAW5E909_9BACI|nr:penicillin acylase family protein [Fredinandcohnia sp. SECRCQ15]MCH1627974.1 penicillin acylase family protein [Fredinandcohnia sp. SECRCQ15]